MFTNVLAERPQFVGRQRWVKLSGRMDGDGVAPGLSHHATPTLRPNHPLSLAHGDAAARRPPSSAHHSVSTRDVAMLWLVASPACPCAASPSLSSAEYGPRGTGRSRQGVLPTPTHDSAAGANLPRCWCSRAGPPQPRTRLISNHLRGRPKAKSAAAERPENRGGRAFAPAHWLRCSVRPCGAYARLLHGAGGRLDAIPRCARESASARNVTRGEGALKERN